MLCWWFWFPFLEAVQRSSSQTFQNSSLPHPHIQVALSLVSTPFFPTHYLCGQLCIIRLRCLSIHLCTLESGRGPGGMAVVTNAGEMDTGTNEFSNCLLLCLWTVPDKWYLSVCLWTAAKATPAEMQLLILPSTAPPPPPTRISESGTWASVCKQALQLLWYHYYEECKKYNKLVNTAKRSRHRHRGQASGYSGESGEEWWAK